MIPENRIPTHPGVILAQEFLDPLGVSQVALAAHLGVPVQRVNELVRGKRGVTPETAWLLAQALDTTPEYWLNLQAAHDLARSRPATAARAAQRGQLKPASPRVVCLRSQARGYDAAATPRRMRPGRPAIARSARRAPREASWQRASRQR